MSITLNTQAMKYRESTSDEWAPVTIQTTAPLDPAFQDIENLASEIGIVVDGNTAAVDIAAGQYIILRNSTINGKDDGLYVAANAINAGTAVQATDIPNTASTVGAANELLNTKVSKSGDTMTGTLSLVDAAINAKNNTMDTTASSIAENAVITYGHNDKNNKYGAYWETIQTSAGLVQTSLAARKRINNADVTNSFYLRVNNDGSKVVNVSEPTAWRSALGLGTNGVLPLTIAQGGTGQDSVEGTFVISSIITAANGFSITSASYIQWGKIASISIVFKKDSTAIASNTSIALGTIVSGKRPNIPTIAGTTDSTHTIKDCYINQTGAVACYGTWAANAEKRIMATYILP